MSISFSWPIEGVYFSIQFTSRPHIFRVRNLIIRSLLRPKISVSCAQGGNNGNGGHGNGNGQGWSNDLGLRSDLIGAENASDNARDHAAHNSAVILVDPSHYDEDGNHI